MKDVKRKVSKTLATQRAGSNPASGTNANLLSDMMQMAVPLWVKAYKDKGGPNAEDMKAAQETSDILGERGEILLCGGGKSGECADQFNRTARAVAVLAFVPGGVTIFGSHFEEKV